MKKSPMHDLTSKFDFIFTPSSYIRKINKGDYQTKIGKSFAYVGATLFEGLRLFIYGVFATAIPAIPLSFMGIGLISYLTNQGINKTIKNNELESLLT